MKHKKTVEPDKPTCEECRKTIPPSVALSEEGSDYIRYFCGADCYEAWKRRRPVGDPSDSNHHDDPR